MLNPRYCLPVLVAWLSLTAGGLADTVILKSGEKVEGRILSETDTEVTIETAVTASIKDQRVIKKSDVNKIEKVQPDLEAWAGLKSMALGEESLEVSDYQRAVTLLGGFATQFPQSPNAAEAKKKVAAFEEELKRVQGGEMKVAGQWLTADEVKEERVQISGRQLLARMKRHVAAGQLVEAMNVFENLDKSAGGSSSFPEAVGVVRQILPTLKAAADQARARLKAQVDEGKRRLENVQGGDRITLENVQKQQAARAEAMVANLEKSGVKWLPLEPATDRSLGALSSKAGGTLQTLNSQNLQRMKDSLAATDRARQAIEKGDVTGAEKALGEANNAWAKNEYISRLQPKLVVAKTKAVETAAADAAAAKAAAAVAAKPTPKPAPKLDPAPATAVVTEEPKQESGSILTNPIFWVVLLLIVGLAAVFGKKALSKNRNRDENSLDQ